MPHYEMPTLREVLTALCHVAEASRALPDDPACELCVTVDGRHEGACPRGVLNAAIERLDAVTEKVGAALVPK